MNQEKPLYLWLEHDPLSGPPDTSIEDVPGVADIELLTQAILDGRLGRLLPAKLWMSDYEQPAPNRIRPINVGKLLRDRSIPHRQRFELTEVEPLNDCSV